MLSIGVAVRFHVFVTLVICLSQCRSLASSERITWTNISYKLQKNLRAGFCFVVLILGSYVYLWCPPTHLLAVSSVLCSWKSAKRPGRLWENWTPCWGGWRAWSRRASTVVLHFHFHYHWSFPHLLYLNWVHVTVQHVKILFLMPYFLSTWCKHQNIYIFIKYIFVWCMRQCFTYWVISSVVLFCFCDLRHCLSLFLKK